jgi:hypothetical protein
VGSNPADPLSLSLCPKVNSKRSQFAYRAILAGGLLCGVLDLTAAIVQFRLRGVRPIRIMQSIAAGLLGREAYQGGTATATLGVALHFLIAFTAATVYYLASRKLAFLRARPFLSGVLYGVAVYFFMNYVVLPLSRFPRGSFNLENLITGILIHMLCVGLPIAYAVQRYADKAVIKN